MSAPGADSADAPLGILAGGGALPRRLIAACRAIGRPVFVVAIEGQADPETVIGIPHMWNRLGAAGRTLDALRDAGCGDVVMAGKIQRPGLAALAPDVRGAALLARIGWRAFGDDGLLRAVAQELERDGFRVVGPQAVLADLLAPAGIWGAHRADAQADADIAKGIAVLGILGPADIGQAVVVQHGLVLAVEAIEGTDAMIRRAGLLRRPGGGGVLVKLPKPLQDRRLDLPAVGPDTVTAMIEAGLAGLAVAAGETLVIDRPAMIATADTAGLFLLGQTP